jgi:hypothetical protein
MPRPLPDTGRLLGANLPAAKAPSSIPIRRPAGTCRAPRPACRRAGTDAGGAFSREALDAGAVASGAKIKPAIGREALCRRGGEQRPLKPGEPGEALHREPRDAGDETGDEAKAQGWAPVVIDTNGNGKLDDYVEPNQVVDPTKDNRIAAGREI